MFKLTFFVPVNSVESVKEALFSAGAGKIGNYDNCCFQLKGEGQFRPLQDSIPYLGQKNIIESVEEYRVEMVLDENVVTQAIQAFMLAHPYETPAYDLQKVYTLEDFRQP